MIKRYMPSILNIPGKSNILHNIRNLNYINANQIDDSPNHLLSVVDFGAAEVIAVMDVVEVKLALDKDFSDSSHAALMMKMAVVPLRPGRKRNDGDTNT
ncbi:hypothetical protein NHQ30_009566 [Ciborinia camelliae]|nr:hypothetical protein NHQ30_009566 [Ciborinia camelliae]